MTSSLDEDKEFAKNLETGFKLGTLLSGLVAYQPKLVLMFAVAKVFYDMNIPAKGETDLHNFSGYPAGSEKLRALLLELDDFVAMHEKLEKLPQVPQPRRSSNTN